MGRQMTYSKQTAADKQVETKQSNRVVRVSSLNRLIQKNYLRLTFVMKPVHCGRLQVRVIFQSQHYSTFEQRPQITLAPCESLS